MKRIPLGYLIGFFVSLWGFQIPAAQNVWTGGAGDGLWSNPTNWSLAAIPDSSQDVVIQDAGGNPVVLDLAVTVNNFVLGGTENVAVLNIDSGSLQCNGTAQLLSNSVVNLSGELQGWLIQLDGTLNWNQGSFSGWGPLTVGVYGQLYIGPGSTTMYGTVINNGTITCLATNLVANGGFHFTNNNLLLLETNLNLGYANGSYPYPNFNNSGIIEVPNGDVVLMAGCSFYNQGTLRAETNATLEILNNTFADLTFGDGTVFDGGGLVRFPGGNFTSIGSIVVSNTVELAGASAYGFNSVWRGPGLFRWVSGGIGQFTFDSGFQVEMDSAAEKDVAGNCVNLGTMVWNGPASLVVSSSASFTNAGQFILETNCAFSFPNGSFTPGSFVNSGRMRVPADTGTVPVSIGCSFQNLGSLVGEGNSVMELHVNGFSGASLQDGSVFEGAGVVRLAEGFFNCSGTMTVSNTVELTGAVLYGFNTVWSGPGLFHWLGGAIGQLSFGSGFQVQADGAAEKDVSGNCLNLGNVLWNSPGPLVISSSATLTNAGQFVLQTNCTLSFPNGSFTPGSFVNSGSLQVPANFGTIPLSIGCSFQSSGNLAARNNSVLELHLNGFTGATLLDGSVFNGLVRFAEGPFTCAGTMMVSNTLELTGASLYGFNSAWSGPGVFRWLGGWLGWFVFAPDFHVEVSGPAGKTFTASCTNFGSFRWLSAATCSRPVVMQVL